ncbi:AraC family transcriptional regulator (plasmid) [Sodalis praecaptivus]|uniref:AraC family transcriptional regulator n=1 Tax=Sodalis praecaptivus TaxID=1239307 RepID=W0I3B1_9GAMM|nr:helix-turn-helix transcriptional regulator [Sodalis praecaptivus]AHF79247.1 AraC family transcriptional regulator [Sodalis praecaptivus]
MRNIPLSEVDAVERSVLAIGTDYLPNTLLARHSHRRAQFLYGISGLMEVETDDGAWVVPPFSGVWIPAGRRHQVLMRGVSTRSLYIEKTLEVRDTHQCEALTVSPLLHQLLLASEDIPALYDEYGREGDILRLALYELRAASALPLFAPLPQDERLSLLCREFLKSPRITLPADAWADNLHCSPRTFSRLFRQQTGMSFGKWRQQACIMAAVTRLSLGESVTSVALDLGYDSPGAFSSMYRRQTGMTPSAYRRGP